MKIVKIANLAITVILASFALACVKEQPKEETPEAPVKFTVELNDIADADYAEVVVRHDGQKDATWFGFVTKDLDSPVENLIQAQLANVNSRTLHVGNVQTVALRNLEEFVNYRYVAFGVNSDGERYGEPGNLAFNTSPVFDVTFQAEAGEIGSHEASFSVSHDGIDVLTYMAFVTDDKEKAVKTLASEHFATLVDSENNLKEGVELLKGTSGTVSFDELIHETDYRFIIYGIYDNSGKIISYGTPAEVKFTTPIDLSIVPFSAAISNITTESATATVTYDAKADDLTWYGFVTEDLTSPAATLIASAINGVTEDEYQTGKNKAVDLNGLTIETDYRFIATGVKDGKAFGVPADVKFSTLSEAYVNCQFTVVASDITPFGATLTITHNGNEDFTYVGFFTEDFDTAVADLELPANADGNLMTGLEKVVKVENLKPVTKYRYVVAGRYAGNEYGHRGEVVFETIDNAVAASYGDFLGNWAVTLGAKYEFSIEPDVEGESYIITGLGGSEIASYGIGTLLKDAATFENGKLILKSQAISAEYVDPTDSKSYTDILCGQYVSASDNKSYYDKSVGQVLATFALMEDGTIELRPGTTADGDVYTGFRHFQVPSEGSTAYNQDAFSTQLPNVITKAAVASDAYLKWLGDWSFAGYTFRITKSETNVNYYIFGFRPNSFGSYYALVDFDSSTGNIVFHHRLMDYTVSSTSGATYEMYTTGINSLNYVAVREGDTELAVFQLNSSGNGGTVTGTTYMHSQGETTVTEIGLLGYSSSGWTKWSGWAYLTLPCEFTKPSSSSISSVTPSYTSAHTGVEVNTFSQQASKQRDKAFAKR